MKKNNLFLFVLSLSVFTAMTEKLHAQCPTISIPDQFEAREEFFTIGTDMTLYADNRVFGRIEERTLNLTPTFEIMNNAHQVVATAKERFFSWGTTVDIFDCQGHFIGMLKEEILESLFSIQTIYSVYDEKKHLVAKSEQFSFFETDFTIYNTNRTIMATLERPMFNFITDTWNVRIQNKSGVNPLLYLSIPIFKTASDNLKERRSDEESH